MTGPTVPDYTIDQAIDDVGGTFAGKAIIRWTNLGATPVDALPLRLHPNAAHELDAGDAGTLGIESVSSPDRQATWDPRTPTLGYVRLGRPVAPGETVTVIAAYDGRLRVLDPRANDPMQQAMQSLGSLGGMGGGDYGLLAEGDGIVVAASAYPMVAPFVDGAFVVDPPARMGDLAWNGVANFHVRTVVPHGLVVVTDLVDTTAALDAKSDVVTSEGANVRDLALVAGRDLVDQSAVVDGVTVRSWYRARDARAGGVVLDAAKAALHSYDTRYGAYPWKELDVAEATLVNGAGGVEFCGMALIAGMLYRSPDDSQSQLAQLMKMWSGLGGQLTGIDGSAPAPMPKSPVNLDSMLEFTVDHEVAHQWFAGLVGNDSRKSPSFDEPLAQYAAVVAYEDAHGVDAANQIADQAVKMNYALYRALGGPDRAVDRDSAAYGTLVEYAGLVYGKAPYGWLSLRTDLGDAALSAALRAAVDEDRFEVVDTPTFVAQVDHAAGGKVKAKIDRYFDHTDGDTDLGVDDSGDFVLAAMLPPDVMASLDQTLPMIGMQRRDLVRMIFGGGLVGDAPAGEGIDPQAALKALEKAP